MVDTHASPPGDGAPQCDVCKKPMALVTAIPRVTEPGRVRTFQCAECEKIAFREM
jgi:hypothetical protein